ncbi:hypothetical protein OPQ81_002640 [Rhizoctonia solani]|nr:hypothetical protein OPQ81_002640 [Rhizoctonia solani]
MLAHEPPATEADIPGAQLHTCMTELEWLHQIQVANGKQPAWPFVDYLEFEFVKWMVVNDISQTAQDKLIKLPIIATCCNLSFSSNYLLNKMLDKLPSAGPCWKCIEKKIIGTLKNSKGQFLTEDIEIWVRDIIEVVKELIGNSAYGKQLVFVPQKIFLDAEKQNQKIDEMWTANWWSRIQELLPPGATVVPIILSSDATQLTNFSGGKSAWPVYISIGNIPKHICAKVNSHSTLLLAYLPVPKLDCFRPKEQGDQKAWIFHQCMELIVAPLKQAGIDGIEMDCGDGYVWHCFPILAAYIADNPEQTLIACCRQNLCHICTVKFDQHQNPPNNPFPLRHPKHTAHALMAQDIGHTPCLFDEQGLKPFGKPFWAELPHCNIFTCLTPDILHQLHKGVFKDHLMNWCLELIKQTSPENSAEDVDHCYKQMPCHTDLHHFLSGVTKLKQSTANEHKEMQKVFIGVMAGLVPSDVLPVIVATLDFIYYACLPTHTTETLNLLQHALETFHFHKHVFIKYGICTDFNINKIHAMSHYFMAIWELGSADGYNTETPE